MGKLSVEIKNSDKLLINYLKSLKNQNYTLTKIFIMRAMFKVRKMIFNKIRSFFKKD